MSLNSDSDNRARKSVEMKLIRSASHLLAKKGPSTLSVREIAKHAGVNHGQVHHYFGGKRMLLKAAIRDLAKKHMEFHRTVGLDMNGLPPPLTLAEDQKYVMAIVRCVIDGDMELATLDIKDGNSVPRDAMAALAKRSGSASDSVNLKATIAVVLAIEWSWAALHGYLFEVLDVKPSEEEVVHNAIAKASRAFFENADISQ